MKSKSPRKYDPEFVLATFEGSIDRGVKYSGDAFAPDMETENQITLEYLDDAYAFCGRKSQPVWGIVRNPSHKRLIVSFRGTINQKDA
mmetsp:Transcript_32142/g.48881  ORF Transcript_32142/g.48881 Transcript_32142/m.48881 type:complete len:88 (-) Transcript_32142:334-597(-)